MISVGRIKTLTVNKEVGMISKLYFRTPVLKAPKPVWRVGLFLLATALLYGCVDGVIDFEDPPLNTEYYVNDVFTDSGFEIAVKPFQRGDGGWTSDGDAEIENRGLAGGSGQDVHTDNVNLDFQITEPWKDLTLRFSDCGGNANIKINGDFRNFADFPDIDNTTIGGVNVDVVDGAQNELGVLRLTGWITEFALGGQELWIDDVEINP